ncbi:MAG: amidohydrolase [Desulfatirhabdiaceae bacterium]|nr:amidohydrolase [Desulfatirhabdiaceae bacterium]
MQLDTLIVNGILVTVNPDFEIIENGWVGIKDGKIVKAQPHRPGFLLPTAIETVNANGGIVMPGLVNTHTHLPMTLFRGLADDLPLMTWLNDHIFPAEAAFIRPEPVYTGTLLACAELLLSGTTTCCDGYFYEHFSAQAVSLSGLRAILGQGVIDYPAPGVPDPSQNISAARDFIHYWQNVNPLIQPSIFCHSPYTCSEKTLRMAKEIALSTGSLFQIHVAETRSEYELIKDRHHMSPVAYLDSLEILDSRTLLVHAIWLDDADIDIVARSGAAISHAPESAMKLGSGIARIPEFIQAKICVGLGTDGCASNNNQDMFHEMDIAAKLHKVSTLNPQAMNSRIVLEMATIAGARAIGMDRTIGSLEPGKQADILILDIHAPHLIPLYHPESHIVYSAKGSDVRDVMIDGKWRVKSRELVSLNLDEILDQARAEGKRIQEWRTHRETT